MLSIPDALRINDHIAEAYGVVSALQVLEVGLRGLCKEDKPDVEGISFMLGCLHNRLKEATDNIMEIAG